MSGSVQEKSRTPTTREVTRRAGGELIFRQALCLDCKEIGPKRQSRLALAANILPTLRDARASLIEDGCNEILSIKAGYQMPDRDLL